MMRSSPPTSPVSIPPPGAASSSSPPQPGRPAAAAPVSAATLRKSRRDRCSSSHVILLSPFRVSPECSPGEALNEPVEEDVVEQGDRDARDERGREQPLPEEDVAADELGGDADRDRLLLRARDERERVDELVEGEREGEDDDRQDPGQRDGEDDAPKRAEARGPVDERRVLEVGRDRLEEAHQEPGGEGDRERGVDEHERDERVLEPDLRDDARERQEEEGGRDEVGEEDADAEALAHAPG